MGLGVLEFNDPRLLHVPGTVLLDVHNQQSQAARTSHLKKGTGKDSEVILVPQPSSDPNDPLNWPLYQRDLILCLYCFCTLLCVGGVGPILSPMALPLIVEFHITFTQVSLLLGYNLVAVGAVGIVVSACACKYGKRPTLLASISCVLAGTIWASRAQSYGSLVGARVFQGLGLAMFESVTYTVISDLYCVHQRGSRMAFYIICQSGLANMPGLVAGKICMTLGWRWAFYLVVIFLVIAWCLCVGFGWETVFVRDHLYDLDTSSENNIDIIEELKSNAVVHQEETNSDKTGFGRTLTRDSAASIPRQTIMKRLKPYHGPFLKEPLYKTIIRPFFVLANPIVLWSILIVSFASLWVIAVALTLAQVYSAPPFLLDTAEIGYISGGPMVGGFIGCIISGLLSDPIIRWLTQRNNGIYEPEFRLPIMILVPITSAIGYFGFGAVVAEGKSPVLGAVFWGFAFVAVQVAAVATGGYIVDAFRDVSIEIFIISMTFKNFLWFGFSFFLNNWLVQSGPSKMFNTIGGIQVALSLTTIPVYVFGKRIRGWWRLHNLLDGQEHKSRIANLAS